MLYKIGDKINLEKALNFSLGLASKGLGKVEPNPCVGSVLFNEETGELVSFGYHEKYGGPHAEVNCLKDIESAEGLTLVVTLEPCSHHGKTPPCADLVIEKKPKKVIYMSQDPNPLVAGRGLERIEQAGVSVKKADGLYIKKNRILNHKFFYAFENKKSYVHLKWAESADGFTAVKEGSPWITNEKSRDHVHFLRAQSQAVLIGRGTLEKDDPSLNVRKEGFEKALKVIVFDPELKSLGSLNEKKISQVRDKKDVIFLCEEVPEKKEGFSFLKVCKNESDEWNLEKLKIDLYSEFKIQSIFVEGGAYTLNQFIKQCVYNRVSIYKGPGVLGENGEKPVDTLDSSKAVFSESFEFLEDKFEDLFF